MSSRTVSLSREEIMTPAGKVSLIVPDSKDIAAVINEVLCRDCYELVQLRDKGVQIKYALDVGAHMGTFAAFVKLLWPGVVMSCFEPNPELAEICKLNVPWANVVTAAVRYDGRDNLFISEHEAGSCMYDPTVNFDDDIPTKYRKIHVPTVRLEPFITSPLDLLKLDCEGSEFDILSSISRDCIPLIKRIVGEYHHVAGFRFVEQIIKLRFPHLTAFAPGDPLETIGSFFAS